MPQSCYGKRGEIILDMGTRLKELRLEKKFMQKDIAEALGIGRQCFGNYENGKRQIDLAALVKLANSFKVSTDYLPGNSDSTTLGPRSGGGPSRKFSQNFRAGGGQRLLHYKSK